jgi:2-haloacid dehalogenase
MTPHTGHRRPAVVAFDVVGTLFSLEPLRFRLGEAGFPETALAEWFARVLHAAVARDVAGTFVPFRDVAATTLEVMAAERGLASSRAAADEIVHGMSELPAYPDVGPAFEELWEAGIRIVALTNGGAQTTSHLLARAGLARFIETIISIDEVGHWKPHPSVYRYAVSIAGVPPVRMCLVASHAWDVLGANRAGLLTAWVARKEKRFHAAMGVPDVTGETLIDVVAELVALPG